MLDGACDVEKLVKRVKELGMPAVAMTDHGNIFGAVHFVNAAKAAGVKPIVGCELYVCKKEDHHTERTPPEGDTYNHLLVLAENEEGYRNLTKITSEASLHGFYCKAEDQQEISRRTFPGIDRIVWVLEGRSSGTAHGVELRCLRAAAPPAIRYFSEKNFISKFRIRRLVRHRIHPGLFQLEKDLRATTGRHQR
jgi:DNA polymerase-3 subunit alpha